jgi:hypothetical protein
MHDRRRRVVRRPASRRRLVPAASCLGGEMVGGETVAAKWRRQDGRGEMSCSTDLAFVRRESRCALPTI